MRFIAKAFCAKALFEILAPLFAIFSVLFTVVMYAMTTIHCFHLILQEE